MEFFKYGFELFDSKYDRFGGHSQWMRRFINLDYLMISLDRPFMFSTMHEWYDGMHHCISIGWLRISWGGRPYPEDNCGCSEGSCDIDSNQIMFKEE